MRIIPLLSLLPMISMSQQDVQETSWEVTGSVSFSLSVQGNLPWTKYKSQLVWAVDVLAGEVASLMNSDWTSNPASGISSSEKGSKLVVNASRPSRVLQSPHPCNITVEQSHRCEVVFASVQLEIDVTADPIQAEDSFESIFAAAVGVGRLQTILLTYFPQSQVQVLVVEGAPTEAPSMVAGNYFGEEDPIDTVVPPTTSNASSEGLSTGGIVGILMTLVVVLFVVVGVASALKRRQQCLVLHETKQDLVIETQETDLIESFSQAGLEWGSPEIKSEKQDPGYPKERDGSFSVQGLPDPDSYPRPTPHSPSSKSTTSSPSSKSSRSSPSSKSSRVVDFAAESHDSSEPPELIIHLDGLEAAIMTRDWDTLAVAAATIQAAHHSSNGSFSRDWSHRDKSWYSALDAGYATELDRLVEQGDWAAVYELAIRLGAQPSV